MYKRFSKQLKMGAEDASSDSESYEDQEDVKKMEIDSESGSEAGDASNSEESAEKAASEESDGIIATEQVTLEELEAGDANVKRKVKRHEVMLYQCSICPEKQLASLIEVNEHISSKVRPACRERTSEKARNSGAHFVSPFSVFNSHTATLFTDNAHLICIRVCSFILSATRCL